MNRRHFWPALIAAFAGVVTACNETTAPARRRRVLALGDSITADRRPEVDVIPYPLQLLELEVADAGIPGLTSRDLLDRWDTITGVATFDVATLMLGVNDHSIRPGESVPRVSLDEYAKNLGAIVARLKRRANLVIVCGPSWVVQTAAPTQVSAVRLASYNECARRAGADAFLDTFAITGAIAKSRDWLSCTVQGDGIHPTTDIQASIAAALQPLMAARFRTVAL